MNNVGNYVLRYLVLDNGFLLFSIALFLLQVDLSIVAGLFLFSLFILNFGLFHILFLSLLVLHHQILLRYQLRLFTYRTLPVQDGVW